MSLFERRVRGFRLVDVVAFGLLAALVLGVYLAKTMAGRERAEIARTELRSELVVLSGCRTALDNRADAPPGNALASLAGSFLAAGARGVVASLWPVGDAAAGALMEQLYFELGRGVEPAEALRRAQARLASDPRWGDPSRWAGFVLLGRPAAIPADRSTGRFAPVAGPLLALAGGALLWRSRRRRGENRLR